MPTQKRVTQACDACHRRRVKCSGGDACKECEHLNIRCLYSPRAPKARTRNPRGTIISRYKAETRHKHLSPTSEDGVWNAGAATSLKGSPPGPQSLQYTEQFFLNLLPDYQASVYPSHPVVHPDEVYTSIRRMEGDQEAKAFVYATAAVTISLSSPGESRTQAVLSQIRDLTNRAVSHRHVVGMSSGVSVLAILTSLFIHHTLFDLAEPQSAFLYLRHALSMLELLRVRETVYSPETPHLETLKRHRLYWLLFIQERFLAMSEYQNIVLLPLPFVAERDPEISENTYQYFIRLIRLFGLVDTTFVQGWVTQNTGADQQIITADWTRAKCLEIMQDGEDSEQDRAALNSMQLADLTITRHWLATHVWRMAMFKGLLGDLAGEEHFILFFPVQLADRLRQEVTTYCFESIEIHGLGIAKKLFELTDTLADLVSHVPSTSLAEHADRIDLLIFLLRLTFESAILDATRKAILEVSCRGCIV